MKKHILFIDLVCYKPYSYKSLKEEPLGGSEASLLRVSKYLDSLGHTIEIYQRARDSEESEGNTRFVTEESALSAPDVIVHMRTPTFLPIMKETFPNAEQYVWHHDLGDNNIREDLQLYQDHCPNSIFVSDFHRHQWIDKLRSFTNTIELKSSCTIYNPVDVGGVKPIKKHNPYKLVFLSSPHKGLKQTLHAFQRLRDRDSRYELHVFNPGYLADNVPKMEGVINHGALPHSKMLKESRDALCLFSCNHIFPETFGLVHCEMATLGVPSLVHQFGATPELLGPRYLVDTRDTNAVIERVIIWSEGERPAIKYTPKNVWEAEWRRIVCKN